MSIIYNVTIKPTGNNSHFHITWHNPEINAVHSFDQDAEITLEESQRLWQWPRCQLPIGQKLFRFLDGDNRCFQQALDQANRLGEKLQIHLRTCKQTADWPFELLAQAPIFLLPHRLHLVRTVSEWGTGKNIHPQDRPLKLLFMACSALDVKPELDFEKEEEAIFHITENLPIEMAVEDSGSLEGLRSQLEKEHFDVVHLSGHANIDENGRPYFIMEDETGYQHNVSPEKLWNDALIENPPRLLFLSGCRTGEVPGSSDTSDTPENTAEGSFAQLLVENNQVPAVLGWGRSVYDDQAAHAGKILFQQLSRGQSILKAVKRVRVELIKNFPDSNKPAWPLLRLFSSGMPLNAIVKENQRWRPKPRRMKHVFLKNSQVQVLAEGFVGRRRQLQTGLRALKQDVDKVGVLLLGTGGLGKSCLAGKICERFPNHTLIIVHGRFNAITLENALNDAFINAQDEKGQQILSQRIKIAEMEFGPDTAHQPDMNEIHQTLLWEMAGSPDLFGRGNFLEKIPLAAGDKNKNFVANTLARLCADSFKDKNYLLLLDDFEQNLEGADKGQPGPLLPEAADLLKALLHYLPFSGKMTQMIITSRYEFSLTKSDTEMLNQRLERIWLTSFQGAELHKKIQELKSILNYEDKSLVPQLLSLGYGNPRLMEWLDILVGQMKAAEVSKLLTAIKDKQEDFIREHVIRELLQRGGKKLESFLRWFSIYRQPVPRDGVMLVSKKAGLSNWEELLKMGMGLSLTEHDHVRRSYQVTPLLREELLNGLEEHKACHEAAFEFYKGVCENRDWINPVLTEEWIFHALGCGEEEVASQQGGRLVEHLREGLAFHESRRVGEWILAEKNAKNRELSTDNDAFLLNALAATIKDIGDSRKAIEYFQQALGIIEALFGQKHSIVALILNNLGTAWDDLGDHRKAIEYYQQALDIDEAVFGKNHSEVAIRLNNLGSAWYNLGDYHKAIDYIEKALDINEAVYGQTHPIVAAELNNVGIAWNNLGDHHKAIEHFQQALDILKEVYGEMHPQVANLLNSLGSALQTSGDHHKAIEYYQQALDIDEAVFEQMHPNVAIRLGNLGSAWHNLGDYRKAIEYYQQALVIMKEFYGETHPQVAAMLDDLDTARKALSDRRKVIEYFEKEHSIKSPVFENDDQKVDRLSSDIKYNQNLIREAENCTDGKRLLALASYLYLTGNFSAASRIMEKAVTYAPDESISPQIKLHIEAAYKSLEEANNIIERSKILHQQGKDEEALQLMLTAKSITPMWAALYSSLGWMYTLNANLVEAKKSLDKALEIDPYLHEAHNNLGMYYLYKKQPEKAKQCFRYALTLKPDFQDAKKNLQYVNDLLNKTENVPKRTGELGVFFWFNRNEISKSGHPFYGCYVYKNLLPYFSPQNRDVEPGYYYFLDGDFISDGPFHIPFQGIEERECLDKISRIDPGLCYVVALYGSGTIDFSKINQALRDSNIIGYIGMTTYPPIDFEEFYNFTGQMALVPAIIIYANRLERQSFNFLNENQLREMGFDVYNSE